MSFPPKLLYRKPPGSLDYAKAEGAMYRSLWCQVAKSILAATISDTRVIQGARVTNFFPTKRSCLSLHVYFFFLEFRTQFHPLRSIAIYIKTDSFNSITTVFWQNAWRLVRWYEHTSVPTEGQKWYDVSVSRNLLYRKRNLICERSCTKIARGIYSLQLNPS